MLCHEVKEYSYLHIALKRGVGRERAGTRMAIFITVFLSVNF